MDDTRGYPRVVRTFVTFRAHRKDDRFPAWVGEDAHHDLTDDWMLLNGSIDSLCTTSVVWHHLDSWRRMYNTLVGAVSSVRPTLRYLDSDAGMSSQRQECTVGTSRMMTNECIKFSLAVQSQHPSPFFYLYACMHAW